MFDLLSFKEILECESIDLSDVRWLRCCYANVEFDTFGLDYFLQAKRCRSNTTHPMLV